MSATHGFSVRIFIPSGEPEQLRIVEKSNWTGLGFVFPRSLFTDGTLRDRLKRAGTGVYVLWASAEAGQLPAVYVGQSDTPDTRLADHVRKKDFWTHAVVFTSKDQNLNTAHVQYLEARLCVLAAEAKRCDLQNGNAPTAPSLSEADEADAAGYLADLLLCLPIVGVSFFDKPRVQPPSVRELYLKAKGIEARGYDGAEGFVVRSGSAAVKDEVASIHAYMADLRRVLVAKGVFEDAGDTWRVTQDYTFSSPSTASGVLLGRTSNGRAEWKDRSGRSLKDIQEAAAVNRDD